MTLNGSKSKIITATLDLNEIKQDPDFFEIHPTHLESDESIKSFFIQRNKTQSGILEGIIEGQSLILQWYPDRVDEKAEAFHQNAVELTKSNQLEMAIEQWEKAIQINPDDVEYLYKTGLALFEQKKYSDSIQYLEKVVKRCSIHFRSYLLLGINYIKLRKFDLAESYILRSNILNRNNILTYLNLGAIYSVKKEYNKSIKMFNQVISIAPNESRAYLGLARIYLTLDDIDAANTHFRKVIELSPGTKLAEYAKRSIVIQEDKKTTTSESREEIFVKGIGHFLSGNYKAASTKYKEYLKESPSDDYAWYLLGETNLRLGNITESADCHKRAIRLNSRKSLYYKALGISLHFLNRSHEVLEVLKKSIDIDKKDALVYTIYGIHFLRIKKTEEAVKYLNIALTIHPNNPLALYNLSLAQLQKDKQKEAVKNLRKILNLEYYVPLKQKAETMLKKL